MARLRTHLLLFIATCFTTTIAGALMVVPDDGKADAMRWVLTHLAKGLPFSVPLMTILLVHEMGHYITARIHGVPASLPYFIPLPPPFPLGTMGAVIGMRPSRNRNHIIDIGAAGPLAGLLVAIPVVIYGIAHSPVGPIPKNANFEGNSILYMLLKRVITGHWLPGRGLDVELGQVAMAGWVGLFITMLNLLPIGQLDGGHVATGYFGGERYERVSRTLHFVLPIWAIGNFTYATLYGHLSEGASLPKAAGLAIQVGLAPMIWFGLMFLLRRMSGGRYHPPLEDEIQPTAGRRALFLVTALVFLLIFMPWPFRAGAG
jgi:membrane-associated protease RseP (regulator of RpoE activity)